MEALFTYSSIPNSIPPLPFIHCDNSILECNVSFQSVFLNFPTFGCNYIEYIIVLLYIALNLHQ